MTTFVSKADFCLLRKSDRIIVYSVLSVGGGRGLIAHLVQPVAPESGLKVRWSDSTAMAFRAGKDCNADSLTNQGRKPPVREWHRGKAV